MGSNCFIIAVSTKQHCSKKGEKKTRERDTPKRIGAVDLLLVLDSPFWQKCQFHFNYTVYAYIVILRYRLCYCSLDRFWT